MSAIELENVLQQMFMECDASLSVSTPDSTISIGDEVPISKIVQYVQDQLPTWSIDDLAEFWKCLAAVSSNDRVNLWQFKEATKCWITKMQQIHSSQDDNNNAREKLYLVSDTDSSMKDMDINRDIVELGLRVKLREFQDENILLRDELERHETSIDNLKQQCNIAERQLDRYVQKCQQLERETDEQRDQLNEAIKNGKATALTLQRCTKEQQNLSRQLEAAEIEIQTIPSLKCKVEKISKEKIDCMKQIAKLQEKFDETEDECKQLKVTIAEMEEISIKMRESYDQTIHSLREKNCQLTEENTELQSLSVINRHSSGERLSLSTIPDIDGCYAHSTPYKSGKILLQDSLYVELKASGFVTECSKHDSCRQELDEYDTAISTILEELDKVAQIFGKTRSSIDDVLESSSQDMNAATWNIEALKHKVTLLLNMANEEVTRKSTKDSSTQLRADPVIGSNDDLDQFGVTGFRDLLLTRAQPYTKTETDLRLITLCNLMNNDDHDDSFSRVIKACNTGTQNRLRIIEPIVEELYDIIESTHKALINHRNHSPSGNSRYRSVHTLPSHSLRPSSPIAKDSKQRTFSCQSSITDSPDVSLARGDFCLKREDHDGKSFPTEPHDVSGKGNLTPKELNILQMDSTTLATTSGEEKTSAKIIEEAIGASNSPSPRRKISVYCRSFDVVTVQDACEDRQGSNREVRRSPSNLGESSARIDERLVPETAKDQNSTSRYPFDHNYRNTKNDSDSSNGSTPQKQFQDSPLEDESPIEQPVLRRVCLAPTRLKLPQRINELNEIACVPDSTEPNVSNSSLSSVVDNGCDEDDNALRSSTTFIIDKCETEIQDGLRESKSCSGNFPRECSTSVRRLFPCNHTDSRKIVDSENPHSQASVQRVESESRVARSVDGQMSSREDSSDSECEPATESSDRGIAEKIDTAASAVSSTSSNDLASAAIVSCKSEVQEKTKTCDRNLLNAKQEKRQRLLFARRSFSESESNGRLRCRCKHQESAPLIPEGNQRRVFPSLTDFRLQESGIANLSSDTDNRENLSELELQDTVRQRNSVSGRMTIRRPSFNSESPVEKIDRTDSSNSIGELRGIFEQTESRRSSREENNNMLRLNHSSNQNLTNYAVGDNETRTSAKQQAFEFLADDEDVNLDATAYTRSSQSFLRSIPWHKMFWGIIIFFLGFFVNQVMVNACNGPLHGWSIDHILSRYIYKTTNAAPHPM